MPKWRRSGGRAVTSAPSTTMRPRSARSKPAISRRAVVLPLPEGPSSARISPFSTASDSSRRTACSPKLLSSRSRTRKGMVGSRAPPLLPRRRAVAAHGAVPGGHPALAFFGDQGPVDVGGLEVAQHPLRPGGEGGGRQVGARRQAEGVAGGELLRLGAPHPLDELLGLG